jgi:hypothetical protein
MTTMHRRPLELAAAAVDFELSRQEREELDRHLAGCSLCRSRIDALRRDALAIQTLPILPVTSERSARLRAATLARRDRSAWPALRLVAVAAILALLALGAVAVGSSLFDRDAVRLTVVEPSPSNLAPAPVAPSPTPSNPAPTESASVESVGYEPPAPACPAPSEAVPAPTIDLSMGDREIILTPTITSQLVTTCSTVMPSDFAEAEPQEAETVLEGQAIDVSVEPGWQILHWEGFDRPRDREGTNVIPGGTLDDRPSSITVAVPEREGDVLVGLTIWAQTIDGRVIANVSTIVWLRIEPPDVGRSTPAAGALNVIPANVSCDAVGWPDDAPRYRTVTFRIDREEPGYASAVTDSGAELDVQWAEGFRVGPGDDRTVIDADGDVVAADGETLDIPDDGSFPDLHGYMVCISPERLTVTLHGADG